MTEIRLPDTFGQAAPILRDAGRVPLPLQESKAPAPPDWARWRDHPETINWPAMIEAYGRTPLTGMTLRETDLVVDIDDEDRAPELTVVTAEILGNSPVIRWGRRPRRQVFYSMREPLPRHLPGITRNLAAVQLMTVGQQVAVAGPHPKTGEPFAWTALPWVEPPPVIDVNMIKRFHDAVREMLPSSRQEESGLGMNSAGLTSYYRERCRSWGPVWALRMALSRVEEGERHYSLVALIGSAISRGLDDDQIIDAVLVGTARWTWSAHEIETELDRVLRDLRAKDETRGASAAGVVIRGPRGPKPSLMELRRK